MLRLLQKTDCWPEKYIAKVFTINILLHRSNFLATSQSQASNGPKPNKSAFLCNLNVLEGPYNLEPKSTPCKASDLTQRLQNHCRSGHRSALRIKCMLRDVCGLEPLLWNLLQVCSLAKHLLQIDSRSWSAKPSKKPTLAKAEVATCSAMRAPR